MKKILCFALVVIVILSYVNIIASTQAVYAYDKFSVVELRAGGGGGSGGGGGGSGGGGSGSSHRHSSSSGSGSGGTTSIIGSIFQLIVFPFVIFSSSIIFYVKITKRARKSKKLMKKMTKGDSAWKYNDISDVVNESFYVIQNAWANMDLSPASMYMSDELYDSFQTKLNWMEYQNKKNVLENIKLADALPVAVYDDNDNSRDYIWFYIKGRMIDYTIDTSTQLKIEGSTSPASFVEYWQYVRRDNRWVLNKILQKDESDQIPFSE